jgi:hypothetical protein
VRVDSRTTFGVKVMSVVLGANVLGAALYLAGKRRRDREPG